MYVENILSYSFKEFNCSFYPCIVNMFIPKGSIALVQVNSKKSKTIEV
jgi:hypothetical protein